MLRTRRGRLNLRIALVSVVLLGIAAASNAGVLVLGDAPVAAAFVEGRIEGQVVSLRPLGNSAAWLPPDPLDHRLSVNGGPPHAALAAELLPDGRVTLRFPVGAGSGDRAVLGLGPGPTAPHVTLRVLTPPDVLPTARFGGAVAQAGGVAYLLGGASDPDGWSTDGTAAVSWAALDSILRIDLDSGEVRTMTARLPQPVFAASAVFDPRATQACPVGCAYVFGGRDVSGVVTDAIVRYDPASDTASLAAVLPTVVHDTAAVWTGEAAYVFGGDPEQFAVLRFDPVTDEVTNLATGILSNGWGARAAFDPRPSAACPAGCGYVVGGYNARLDAGWTLGLPAQTQWLGQKAQVLRFDPATGSLAALPVALPPLEGAVVAWDGARVLIAGGGSCGAATCIMRDEVTWLDPVTLATGTLPEPLALPLGYAAGVWHEGTLVLLDGAVGTGEPLAFVATAGFLDALVRYRP